MYTTITILHSKASIWFFFYHCLYITHILCKWDYNALYIIWNICKRLTKIKVQSNSPSCNLDIVDSWATVLSLSQMYMQRKEGTEGAGCFYALKLWAVEFNLGFTSDIVPPHPSSYSLGFMEWDRGSSPRD